MLWFQWFHYCLCGSNRWDLRVTYLNYLRVWNRKTLWFLLEISRIVGCCQPLWHLTNLDFGNELQQLRIVVQFYTIYFVKRLQIPLNCGFYCSNYNICDLSKAWNTQPYEFYMRSHALLVVASLCGTLNSLTSETSLNRQEETSWGQNSAPTHTLVLSNRNAKVHFLPKIADTPTANHRLFSFWRHLLLEPKN